VDSLKHCMAEEPCIC